MIDPIEIPLLMAQEYANWARHYDNIRIGISSLLLGLATAVVPAAFWLADKRAVCVALLSAFLVAGVLLTGLGVTYNKYYLESSWASYKMRLLAVKQLPVEPRKINRRKLDEKVAQAYYEAMCPSSTQGRDCAEKDPARIPKQINAARQWRAETAYKLFGSSWFWLNTIVGIIAPVALIVLVRLGKLPRIARGAGA